MVSTRFYCPLTVFCVYQIVPFLQCLCRLWTFCCGFAFVAALLSLRKVARQLVGWRRRNRLENRPQPSNKSSILIERLIGSIMKHMEWLCKPTMAVPMEGFDLWNEWEIFFLFGHQRRLFQPNIYCLVCDRFSFKILPFLRAKSRLELAVCFYRKWSKNKRKHHSNFSVSFIKKP